LSIGANGVHPAFSAATATQLQNLSQLLKDFSSADILLFLMLMRGLDPQHKVHGGGGGTGGALLDLLAGLALARQVNQLTSDLTSTVPSTAHGATGGHTGGHLNLHV
jgi:hypothetical protein